MGHDTGLDQRVKVLKKAILNRLFNRDLWATGSVNPCQKHSDTRGNLTVTLSDRAFRLRNHRGSATIYLLANQAIQRQGTQYLSVVLRCNPLTTAFTCLLYTSDAADE